MNYDPIKKTLGRLFNHSPFSRKVFYHLLDILLLRTWHVHKALRHFSRNKPAAGISVLDAGSGFGQYTYYLARKHPEWIILALDVKTEEIEACNVFFNQAGLSNTRFKVGDLTEFTQEKAFDLILSVDVMEHIKDDKQVFRNFYKSLKDGGMLLISTPSDQGGSDVHDPEQESFIGEHVRDGYGKQEIEEKLKHAGFGKIITQYTYGAPGKISWRLSMKYPILILGVSKWFLPLLPFYYLLVMPFSLLLNAMDVRQTHKTGTGLMVKAFKLNSDQL
ncbi:MAG: class I SAM-dependent methyltransferase [Bacteroidales bacterium]|mgnify:CR=1 FL=1|jgi:2-polyprenyl-3-methyl-5-hydroxy-6-metoxy-1,4-benzoquinol methylase|nr:class I SAM-dependent methyltransferase [Bacteroidales bacterium]NLM92606.1 class I SAM-dependent methyltransferase [Bacteroidales bacterium]